jgi:S1-C subfamily serine protease
MKTTYKVIIGLVIALMLVGIANNPYEPHSHEPIVVPALAPTVAVVESYPVPVPELSFTDLDILPRMKAATVTIRSKKGTSSGVIIDAPKGVILTCAHATTNRSNVKIILDDGRTAEAYSFQIHRYKKYDLTLIYTGVDLGPAQVSIRREPVKLGEEVIVIGSPTGYEFFYNSLSFGRITGVDRRILKGQSGGLYDWSAMDLIQTDAPINGGNSGGPVFDTHGQLVGVAVMHVIGSDGLSMAVPAEYILRILETK